MFKELKKGFDNLQANVILVLESIRAMNDRDRDIQKKLSVLTEQKNYEVSIDINAILTKEDKEELTKLASSAAIKPLLLLFEAYKRGYSAEAFKVLSKEKYEEIAHGFAHLGAFMEVLKEFDPKYHEEKRKHKKA